MKLVIFDLDLNRLKSVKLAVLSTGVVVFDGKRGTFSSIFIIIILLSVIVLVLNYTRIYTRHKYKVR